MESIATPVVEALRGKALEAVEKEAQYALNFRDQFDDMVVNLRQAKGLLDDNEHLKLKNRYVKPVLIQLRKLIYEADDILTDCLIRDEYSEDGLSSFLCQCNLFFLNRTGKKLVDINAQMNKNLETLGKYLQKPENDQKGGDQSQHDQERMVTSQDYKPPNEIIGLENDIMKIKQWIFDPSKELHRIGIVGMGGLGKTTIAQKIFNDTEVFSRFTVLWVTISKTFSKYRILKTMIEKLGRKIPEKADDKSNLLGVLRKALEDDNKANYLVVMDDVWSMDNVSWWDDLCSALTLPNRSSSIIITTRDEDVARTMVGDESRIHWPKKLDKDKSWLLFSRFAFRSSGGICQDSQFEKVGKNIVDKCGGLPLSLKTLGSLLAPQTKLSTWTEVSESFHIHEGNIQVIDSLRLSYDNLEAHLQQCLLCLSVYPEDFEISAQQLIHWWVAEGLIPKTQDSTAVLELGYQYLSKLISRCLVEVVDRRGHDGRVEHCKIHDTVRELIMTIAEEEQFCLFDEQGIQVWNKDSYWLGFTDEMNLQSFGKNAKLRALILLSASHSFDFDRNPGLLQSLRVLDLSSCSDYIDEKCLKNLLDWIGALKRLACLNLSEVDGLIKLPSSICKLLNLQLLVLTGCTKLKRLPPSITKLKKLIVLHVGGCPLEYLPCGLERLSGLQELTGFKVDQKNVKASGLLQLKNLRQLKVLQIVLSNDDIEISESDLSKILSDLKTLKVLDIEAHECTRVRVLEKVDSLSPPGNLKELYLRNFHRKTLPKWVDPSELKNLQFLYIEDAKSIINFIPEDEEDHSKYVWEVLEGLCLIGLPELKVDRKDIEKAFPQLRHMKVTSCPKLTNFPDYVLDTGIWLPKAKS